MSFLLIGFFYLWLRTERRIKKINNILKEVCTGNFNQYFRIEPTSKNIRELSSYLNRITKEVNDLEVKAKRTEEERRKMISNISHDLRTPLTSLLGFIEVLQNDEILEEEREEFLNIVQRKGKDMLNLIEYFSILQK